MFSNQLPPTQITPSNAIPQSASAIIWWVLVGLGLATFFLGGVFLILLGLFALFGWPHLLKKRLPVSFVLNEKELCCLTWNSTVAWSIPWEDIESLHFVPRRWPPATHIGLRLKRYDRFEASYFQAKANRLTQVFLNPSLLQLMAKIITYSLSQTEASSQRDVILPYQWLDRPTKKFAELLSSYMYYSRVTASREQ